MAARHLLIGGRVQGVGFRWAMCAAAREHGVRGWVRNRRDGQVEAVVDGDDAAVESMLAWARRGPRAARVDRLDVRAATAGEIALIGEGFAPLDDA